MILIQCVPVNFCKIRENVLDAYEVLVLKWNMLLKEKNSYKRIILMLNGMKYLNI